MENNYLKKILRANVYDVAKETPLDYMPRLSARLNNRIWLKREDLQPVFSFKLRGAYNKISNLSTQAKEKGVITASAGNHAQGVALSAGRMGIRNVIVMPKTTPQIKINAVKALGGEVVLSGNTYDEAYTHARNLADKEDLYYVPPYDDPDVIAGQGTVAMEILRQYKGHIDAIFVPVGGGGLAAGVAVYVKQIMPDIKIIAVEAEDSACLKAAMDAGERVILPQVGLFADGVAVAQIGEHTWDILKNTVDECITVSTDEICAAIKDIFDETRSIAEPAGALTVAGAKKYVEAYPDLQQHTFIAIDSGANMNFDRLRHVAERAEIGEHREALLAVTIAEQPGSFRKFCHILGQRNITEFNYRYADASQAHVFAGVQLKEGLPEKEKLLKKLHDNNYPVIDLSDNEMAKIHVRYMVGGRAVQLRDEHLFRFQFPERPGALARFLSRLGQNWNISLFHYRNHGADFGRVLVGIQVKAEQLDDLNTFLDEIGYPYWSESENPAYQLFLR